MSERTEIAWADSTFNYWEGCQKVGPGCDNCYAEARNARFGGGVAINWGPGAPRRLTSEHNRGNLRRWNGKAFHECGECGWRGETKDAILFNGMRCPGCGTRGIDFARRRVFCSSLSDVFDNAVDDAWRLGLFAEMEATPNIDKLVLTKRIGNVRGMVPSAWLEPGGWPAHIRLGITVCNQSEYDRDIGKLADLNVPNFLSVEPLLGPIDMTGNLPRERALRWHRPALGMIDWVIVGGESGPGARPMHPDWARSLRNQCEAAGVPYLFKQWGEWLPDNQNPAITRPSGDTQAIKVGKKAAGRLLDGLTHDGFPT